MHKAHGKDTWHTGVAEFLFSPVSSVVVQEALQQLNEVFENGVPTNLITVHMRWGDKHHETNLALVEEYIGKVEEVKKLRGDKVEEATNLFLVTEDINATQAFRATAPSSWTIYGVPCHNLNRWMRLPHPDASFGEAAAMAHQTLGRLGLLAMGTLLAAMQSNAFVLTRSSRWTQLINHLRKGIILPGVEIALPWFSVDNTSIS